jgi:hypothetical protein
MHIVSITRIANHSLPFWETGKPKVAEILKSLIWIKRHYAYFKVSGDFDYVVRVQDLEGPDGWSKAELMAREPDSASDAGSYTVKVSGANGTLTSSKSVVTITSDTAFDVYSDGFTEWNNYDETTFVYEKITGDFDKKVRVEYQDLSSQWARAGIIVRDVTNFGVDQTTQAGTATAPPFDGKAGKYQKVHVNPVGPTLTGPGTAGNASWEGNRRLATGATSSSALFKNNATPNYPNAWCRLQRIGQLFIIYRSDDGVNWLQLGTTIFDEAMPDTV